MLASKALCLCMGKILGRTMFASSTGASILISLLIFNNKTLAPGQVKNLRGVAATDSSIVLSWTEASSGSSAIAKYVVRYGPFESFSWSTAKDVIIGGCAAPVHGSNPAGGRTRSCVLEKLEPYRLYKIQIAAYTGTLNSSAVFGPLSNIIEYRTSQRIGPMIVDRPIDFIDSVRLTQVEFSDWPNVRWPITGVFWTGDHYISAFRNDTLVARGYLLVTSP